MRIDLNCDMGESRESILNGTQEALLRFVTSASVACGGHAGDEWTMRETVRAARAARVSVGAHPGYPDPENFGRLRLAMSAAEIADTVFEQVTRLAAIAGEVAHVKPHGALYNVAAQDREVGRAIADGVARWRKNVVLVGLAGSIMLDVWREMGFSVAAEAFADRAYNADGTLRSRSLPGALLTDPEQAAAHAVSLVKKGVIDTLCIHGDTPGAPAIAAAVAERLKSQGIELRPLLL